MDYETPVETGDWTGTLEASRSGVRNEPATVLMQLGTEPRQFEDAPASQDTYRWDADTQTLRKGFYRDDRRGFDLYRDADPDTWEYDLTAVTTVPLRRGAWDHKERLVVDEDDLDITIDIPHTPGNTYTMQVRGETVQHPDGVYPRGMLERDATYDEAADIIETETGIDITDHLFQDSTL